MLRQISISNFKCFTTKETVNLVGYSSRYSPRYSRKKLITPDFSLSQSVTNDNIDL